MFPFHAVYLEIFGHRVYTVPLQLNMSTPKIALYDHPVSSYAQKVRLLLREKNIPFERINRQGMGTGVKIADLAAVNPRVEIPAIIDGDVEIFDSKVILQYLEEKYPEVPLMPKDPKDRAKARLIEEVCDSQYEAINWGIGELLWAERAGTGELKEKMLAEARQQTNAIFEWLENYLGDKPYFNGDSFGFADLVAVPYINRSFLYGTGPANGSPLKLWRERVMERPSCQQTCEEMYAGAAGMAANFPKMFKAGSGARREYRDHRLEWMIKSGGMSIVEKGMQEDTIRFSWPGGI